MHPTWCTPVKLWEVWAWALRWLWALVSQLLWACSLKQNGSSSAALPQQPLSGDHLPSLRLKSGSCVTSSSCAPWAAAAAAGVTSATGKKYTHLSAWMNQGYGFEWCGNVVYTARLHWTFTPNIAILLLKEGSMIMLLGVQHALFAWRSPVHGHISPGENNCFGRCFSYFFNWWLQTTSENL